MPSDSESFAFAEEGSDGFTPMPTPTRPNMAGSSTKKPPLHQKGHALPTTFYGPMPRNGGKVVANANANSATPVHKLARSNSVASDASINFQFEDSLTLTPTPKPRNAPPAALRRPSAQVDNSSIVFNMEDSQAVPAMAGTPSSAGPPLLEYTVTGRRASGGRAGASPPAAQHFSNDSIAFQFADDSDAPVSGPAALGRRSPGSNSVGRPQPPHKGSQPGNTGKSLASVTNDSIAFHFEDDLSHGSGHFSKLAPPAFNLPNVAKSGPVSNDSITVNDDGGVTVHPRPSTTTTAAAAPPPKAAVPVRAADMSINSIQFGYDTDGDASHVLRATPEPSPVSVYQDPNSFLRGSSSGAAPSLAMDAVPQGKKTVVSNHLKSSSSRSSPMRVPAATRASPETHPPLYQPPPTSPTEMVRPGPTTPAEAAAAAKQQQQQQVESVGGRGDGERRLVRRRRTGSGGGDDGGKHRSSHKHRRHLSRGSRAAADGEGDSGSTDGARRDGALQHDVDSPDDSDLAGSETVPGTARPGHPPRYEYCPASEEYRRATHRRSTAEGASVGFLDSDEASPHRRTLTDPGAPVGAAQHQTEQWRAFNEVQRGELERLQRRIAVARRQDRTVLERSVTVPSPRGPPQPYDGRTLTPPPQQQTAGYASRSGGFSSRSETVNAGLDSGRVVPRGGRLMSPSAAEPHARHRPGGSLSPMPRAAAPPRPQPHGTAKPSASAGSEAAAAARTVAGLLGVLWPPAAPLQLYFVTGTRLTSQQVESFYETARVQQQQQQWEQPVAGERHGSPRPSSRGNRKEHLALTVLSPSKALRQPSPSRDMGVSRAAAVNGDRDGVHRKRPVLRRTQVLRGVFDLLDWRKRGALLAVELPAVQHLFEEELAALDAAAAPSQGHKKTAATAGPQVSLAGAAAAQHDMYASAYVGLSRGLSAARACSTAALPGYDNPEPISAETQLGAEKATRRALFMSFSVNVIIPLAVSSRIHSIDFPTLSLVVFGAVDRGDAATARSAEGKAWRKIVAQYFEILS